MRKHSSRFVLSHFYFIAGLNKLVLRNKKTVSLTVCSSGLYRVFDWIAFLDLFLFSAPLKAFDNRNTVVQYIR